MSGPRDARETAEPAGTPSVPADGAEPAAPAPLRPPAFGLEAPWWAAESTDTAPPAENAPADEGPPAEEQPATDDVTDDASAEDGPAEETPGEEEVVFGTEPAEDRPADPEATVTDVPPGTLVAGLGVPSVDSRRAVPAEPIVKRPPAFGDTDPDGFPAVRPEDDAAQEPAVEETATDEQAADTPAADERPAEAAPEPPPPPAEPPPPPAEPPAEPPPAPSAFEKAKEAENAPLAPVLVPDAILPPGVVPPTGSGPFPNTGTAEGAAPTAEQPAVITPVYHAEGGVPIDTPPPPGRPPQRDAKGGGGGSVRRPLLIGGVAAVILAAAVALFTVGGPGSDRGEATSGKAAESPAATRSTPAATPSPTATPVNINDEKTDTKDLAVRDVFPTGVIKLGGRTYTRERWSLNRDASYAARGSMLRALKREQCRKIIRATYIDRERNLAVTSGIAVMPTKEAALRISKAGSPAKYEWFRGMGGRHAPDLDRAGGYAASTFRGRYVAYAYVQWANGKKARPGDPTIKQAAQQFLDYDLRPIIERARG